MNMFTNIALGVIVSGIFLSQQCGALVTSKVHPRLLCTIDYNCTEGVPGSQFRCESGRCTTGFDAPSYSCTDSCPQYHTCVAGRCEIGTTEKPCKPSGGSILAMRGPRQCLYGFECDIATNKCVAGTEGAACTDEMACQKGLICDRGDATLARAGIIHTYTLFERPVGVCSKSFVGAKHCFTDRECGGLLCKKASNLLPGTCVERCTENCATGYLDIMRGRPCNFTASYSTSPCAPGSVCKPNPGVPVSPYGNTPGTCVSGVIGTKCDDGASCEKGLVCGSWGACVKSAEGQRCLSSFWCPAGAKCAIRGKACTFQHASRPATDFMAETVRPPRCTRAADCAHVNEARCVNGVCLSWNIGKTCDAGCGFDMCVDGRCRPGLNGDSCTRSWECFQGLQCVGCPADVSCSTPLRQCDIVQGKVCARDSPGVCRPTAPGSRCTAPRNCADGLSCATLVRKVNETIRTCVPGKPGVRCDADRNCVKRLKCVQNLCTVQGKA